MDLPKHPDHVEFALVFVIRACGVTQPRSDRRLNAIEASLANLTRRWRASSGQPLDPVSELRLSHRTLADLLGWLEEQQPAGEDLRDRIEPYRSGLLADPSVPDGWVRVIISPNRNS
jgi:hypothetical protein